MNVKVSSTEGRSCLSASHMISRSPSSASNLSTESRIWTSSSAFRIVSSSSSRRRNRILVLIQNLMYRLPTFITVFNRGTLNGQRGEIKGAIVVRMTKNAQAEIRGSEEWPIRSSTAAVKTHSPMKNRPSEIWSRSGRAVAISKTFHFPRAG